LLETEARLEAAIASAQTIALAGHASPDGDAIGSCAALATFLDRAGKNVYVLLEDYDTKYNIIPVQQYIYSESYDALAPDLFIALDSSTADRLGKAADVMKRAKTTALFDHHIGNAIEVDISLTDTVACSTTLMIYRYINRRTTIDAAIAAPIYAGLVYDTGGFRHSSTTPEAMLSAAHLIQTGIDFSKIYRSMLFERSKEKVPLYAAAIANITYVEPDTAYTCVTLADKATHGGEYPDGVVDYLINIRGVNTAIYATEREEGVEVSMRSRVANVGELAGKLGGGGHKAAAGFKAQGTTQAVIDNILKYLQTE